MSLSEAESAAHEALWAVLDDLEGAVNSRFPSNEGVLAPTRHALLDLHNIVWEQARHVWKSGWEQKMRYDRGCSYQVALTSDLENLAACLGKIQEPAHLTPDHVVSTLFPLFVQQQSLLLSLELLSLTDPSCWVPEQLRWTIALIWPLNMALHKFRPTYVRLQTHQLLLGLPLNLKNRVKEWTTPQIFRTSVGRAGTTSLNQN